MNHFQLFEKAFVLQLLQMHGFNPLLAGSLDFGRLRTNGGLMQDHTILLFLVVPVDVVRVIFEGRQLSHFLFANGTVEGLAQLVFDCFSETLLVEEVGASSQLLEYLLLLEGQVAELANHLLAALDLAELVLAEDRHLREVVDFSLHPGLLLLATLFLVVKPPHLVLDKI
jgi:hypothetical protein